MAARSRDLTINMAFNATEACWRPRRSYRTGSLMGDAILAAFGFFGMAMCMAAVLTAYGYALWRYWRYW